MSANKSGETAKKPSMSDLLKANRLKGTEHRSAKIHHLDTGFAPLNEIVSGSPELGLPSGQLVMVAGPSGAGKTIEATQMMISTQQAGGYAAFFDYETQYHLHLGQEMGLETGDDNFQYYLPESFEEGVTDAIKLATLIRENKIIPDDAPITCIFDSLQAMTPLSKLKSLKESTKNGENLSMHDNYALSTACSAWFPTIQQQFARLNVTGVFINQVRKKTDKYGNVSFTFPGGDAPYYYCSTVIVLTAQNIFEGKGLEKRLSHKEITAFVEKSRNTVPYSKVKYDFVIKDGTGKIDAIGSYFDHLLRVGAIERSGPRVLWEGGKPFASQVKEALATDPDAAKKLGAIHKAFGYGKPLLEDDDEPTDLSGLEEDTTE